MGRVLLQLASGRSTQSCRPVHPSSEIRKVRSSTPAHHQSVATARKPEPRIHCLDGTFRRLATIHTHYEVSVIDLVALFFHRCALAPSCRSRVESQ